MKLKALDILSVLQKENFRFERFDINEKPVIIDKITLKEAVKELKVLQNKNCISCKYLNKNAFPKYTSATAKECELLNIKLQKIEYCSGWENV